MGAGPVLIKNGVIIKGNPEGFNENNVVYTRQPRSGVCYDSAGRFFLIAIAGRYPESEGLTFEEFAILLQD